MTVDQIEGMSVVRMAPRYSGLEDQLLAETERELLDLIEQHPGGGVVLDFAETEYFTSNFIEVVFRVWRRYRKSGGRVVLARLQPFCKDVMHTARLDTLWTLEDDLDVAIKRAGEKE